MRASIKRSFRCLLFAAAAVFSAVGAVTPVQAQGGGPISGGLIALSGGLDVSGGIQGPTPPSSTHSASNADSHQLRHGKRSSPRW